MKRQVAGLRRISSEEAEQNQSNDRKRIKLLKCSQDKDILSSMENATGLTSDAGVSFSQGNGQDTLWHDSVIPEDKPYESPFENGSCLDPHLNGSSNSLEENGHMNPLEGYSGDLSVNVTPANLEDETIIEPFQMDVNNSSPPDLQPEVIPVQEESLNENAPNIPNMTEVNDSKNNLESHSLGDVIPSEKSVINTLKENEDSPASTSQNDNIPSQVESHVPVETKSTAVKMDNIENLGICDFKLTRLEGHADVIFCVDSDEDIVLSSSGDTTVKVWNVEEEKEVSNFAGHTDAVTSVILLNSQQSEDIINKLQSGHISRVAVSASMDCHIRLWSLYDGQEITSIYTFNSITCMGYLQNKMYVIVGTEGGKLELWDLRLSKLVNSVYAHTSSVTSITVNDCYVYSVAADGAVKVFLFDDEELQPLYTRKRKQVTSTAELAPTQWKSVAEHNDLLFLGDNTSYLKVLNWRLGQLKLYANQEGSGICECVLVKDDILLSSFHDSSTDTGGINVWRLPGMTYVCTLTGDVQDICSLGLTRKTDSLRIVSGGHQLLVWDFDLLAPAKDSSKNNFFVREIQKVGFQVEEKSTEPSLQNKPFHPTLDESNSKTWCNIS